MSTLIKIVANHYLNLVTDEETGEKRLFGKFGYQTMSKNTDKYTLINMAAASRAMAAGELRDINGEEATDGCIIKCYARLTKVKEGDAIEQIATIRTMGDVVANVPVASASELSDNPFGS